MNQKLFLKKTKPAFIFGFIFLEQYNFIDKNKIILCIIFRLI
jgi:hypothetical protein